MLPCFELCFELPPSSDDKYASLGVGGSGSGERGIEGDLRASEFGVAGGTIAVTSNSTPGLRSVLDGRVEVTEGVFGKALTLILFPLVCLVNASSFLFFPSVCVLAICGGRYRASAPDGIGGASGLIANDSSLCAPPKLRSERGRVYESERARPPAARKCLEARLSEGRTNELDIKARAKVDPDTADDNSSSAVDMGRAGLYDVGASKAVNDFGGTTEPGSCDANEYQAHIPNK